MSLGAEWLTDHEYELNWPRINTSVWRTRDGQVLKIAEMTSEHIKNCMNMIGEDNPYWWPFAKELLRRVGVKI